VTRLKIVVAGGGLISQVEHIPNLLLLKDKYELVAVADPSPSVRKHIADHYGLRTCADVGELWGLNADAIVIGAPDSYHHAITTEALERGLHVLCEKPLALSTAAIDDLIGRRDAARRILQVGYMKRWDPSYEMLLEEVCGQGHRLRFIAVEVNDPDSWPFVEHQPFVRTNDVPAELRVQNSARLEQQVSAATRLKLGRDDIYAYVDSFSSSMIHDLNAVQGLLKVMGISNRRPLNAHIFADGRGTSAVLGLNGFQAVCHFAHVVVPKLAEYNERISLFFDDRRYELIFPSPYLHNFPTRLISYTSNGMRLAKTEHSNGYQEAFVQELVGFWRSIVEGVEVRNTPEDAREDMELVGQFMSLALASRQAMEGGE
jgi:predicted dehydrogenase